MRQSLYIGSTPPGEPCAQLGSDDYGERARPECRAYIGQLRRTFGPEPHGCRLYVASNPHDFGTYLSVNCEYDEEDEATVEYAYRCEGEESPDLWDEQARRELGMLDHAGTTDDAATAAGEVARGD